MDPVRDRDTDLRPATGFDETQREKTDALLRNLGADDVLIETVTLRIDDDDVKGIVKKLRTFAQENPAVVLSALSALIAGGAVAAGRAVVKKRRATQRGRAEAKTALKPRRASSKRTLIEPHPVDKRYVRRDAKGRIKESVDVGRSLSADARHRSKTRAKSGAGDKGDR